MRDCTPRRKADAAHGRSCEEDGEEGSRAKELGAESSAEVSPRLR